MKDLRICSLENEERSRSPSVVLLADQYAMDQTLSDDCSCVRESSVLLVSVCSSRLNHVKYPQSDTEFNVLVSSLIELLIK